MNGSASGAGIVLPDSQTENFAIDQIEKNGLMDQRAALAKKAYQAQTNKDFSDNKLAVAPSVQYQSELNGLAQQWFDKGVGYRKQGFDPFNPDYTKPDQVSASEQYLNEKKHIENLSDLSKAVDADYKDKQKLNLEGKLGGFDDYHNALTGNTLQGLYKAGGIGSLPQLYKPLDLSEVDKGYHIVPQSVQKDEEIAPGVTNTVTHKYVNIPQAAATYEQLLNNTPGSQQYLQQKGITNPKKLYTYNGHNMLRDANNPADFGHIDEPGIYHQMATDYLTNPALIKQLPDVVKQKIIANNTALSPDGAKTAATNILNSQSPLGINAANAGNIVAPAYNAADDPDYKAFIDGKFNDQIKQERSYQDEIASGVQRKLPSVALGDTSKLDATMANLALRKETNSQGWSRIGMEKDRLNMEQQKWQSKLTDDSTRAKWVGDIQNMNPDAITTLNSAIKEIHGRIVPTKTGIAVQVPELVPNVDANGTVNAVSPKKQVMTEYQIDKHGGRGARMRIEQLLNKLPSVGKEKVLKTEKYSPSYNELGGGDSADDL